MGLLACIRWHGAGSLPLRVGLFWGGGFFGGELGHFGFDL